MTNLDERIKKELAGEASAIDELLANEGGLPDLVAGAYMGSMRRWMWLTGAFALILTALMAWCGYEFFTATNTDDRVFWGICLIFSAMPQVALKQWQWMEMNRASLMREVKRLELAIATLAARPK
jgi:hypothetical protein